MLLLHFLRTQKYTHTQKHNSMPQVYPTFRARLLAYKCYLKKQIKLLINTCSYQHLVVFGIVYKRNIFKQFHIYL